MKATEKWLPVVDYEGYYEVSNKGRVRSLPRRTTKGRVLKDSPRSGELGYRAITLSKNGVSKSVNIHRLVAKAFLDNPDNKPCVNHIDGVRGNNNVKNLEWCTYQENERHSFDVLGKQPWEKRKAAMETISCLECGKQITDRVCVKRKYCDNFCSGKYQWRVQKVKPHLFQKKNLQASLKDGGTK